MASILTRVFLMLQNKLMSTRKSKTTSVRVSSSAKIPDGQDKWQTTYKINLFAEKGIALQTMQEKKDKIEKLWYSISCPVYQHRLPYLHSQSSKTSTKSGQQEARKLLVSKHALKIAWNLITSFFQQVKTLQMMIMKYQRQKNKGWGKYKYKWDVYKAR